MFFLFAKVIIQSDIVVDKIEIFYDKVRLHIQDFCSITLEGDFSGLKEENFFQYLKTKGISVNDIVKTVQDYKAKEMCDFVYYDSSLKTSNNVVHARFQVPDSTEVLQYSGAEKTVTKGLKVPFSLLPTHSNISYDPYTAYRIYLPKGPIKGVIFDIYGGGVDRLYYPFCVSSQEVSAEFWWTLTKYKNFFRGFLKKGIAVVTLRLTDCRISIKDEYNLSMPEMPFVGRNNVRLFLKHQAYYFEEMEYLKKEIKNFLDHFDEILPQAQNAPKIFLGMSFGGVLGLFIVQNPKSEDWFDHYILMETPTYEFKGIVGDTIYNKLEKLTYLNHKVYFIFGSLDKRIYGGHDTFFLNKVRNRALVKVDYMKNVGHDLPTDSHPVVDEILDYCKIQ